MGGTIGPEPEYYVKKFVRCNYEKCTGGYTGMFWGTQPCPVCHGKEYIEVMVRDKS